MSWSADIESVTPDVKIDLLTSQGSTFTSRRRSQTAAVSSWTWRWALASDDTKDALEALYVSTGFGSAAFSWTWNSVVRSVRFVSQPTFRRSARYCWEIEVTVELYQF